MEFLRPILVKIELICQQPAMTRPTGVIGVISLAMWCWIGWLGADAVVWIYGVLQDCSIYSALAMEIPSLGLRQWFVYTTYRMGGFSFLLGFYAVDIHMIYVYLYNICISVYYTVCRLYIVVRVNWLLNSAKLYNHGNSIVCNKALFI